MTLRQSIRLGSISGIPVGINWGLLLIAALYTLNLAVGILPATAPDASMVSYWFFALVGVVAFFGSILAHELGHSIVAQRNGIRVKAITLWLLGGVAELEREADDPGVEFRVAVAGPAVSVALAAGFAVMAWFASTLLGTAVLGATLGYLALLNGVLAVFNMIPAAPLDGGRVLSAALWKRSQNRHEARARAARAGELFGGFLLAVGVVGFLFGYGTFIMAILGSSSAVPQPPSVGGPNRSTHSRAVRSPPACFRWSHRSVGASPSRDSRPWAAATPSRSPSPFAVPMASVALCPRP